MSGAKWWLVCYDVHDPARLRRAAAVLEGAGQRMQYSVFRCWMTPSQMHSLRWELTQVLEPVQEIDRALEAEFNAALAPGSARRAAKARSRPGRRV